MQLALLEPTKLFQAAQLDRGSDQLRFAVITTSVFWAIGQILERAVFSGQRSPMLQKLIDSQAQANSWGATIGLTIFTPIFAFIFIYLNAGITHGVALMLGQSKRGFPATFAACAYSCAPLVLLAVPACGSPISLVWLVVLTGIGMKQTHRISAGGAAATVLTPYFLLCCLIFAATGALLMVLRNTMGPQ